MFVLTFAADCRWRKGYYWRDGGKPSGEGNQSLESGEPLAYGKSITEPALAGMIPMLCYVNWRMQ